MTQSGQARLVHDRRHRRCGGCLAVAPAVRTHNVGLLVGSLLIASGSVTALVEALCVRRPRNGASSSAAIGILAGLTLAGALTCLLATLIRPGA